MGGYRTKVTAATPQLLPTGQIGAFVSAALERGDSVQYVPAQISLPFTDIVTVTTLALPVGLEGFAYTAALAALGGTLPYTWGATGLPSWATLSGNTISGTPNSTAPSTLTVTATDADGRVSLPVVLSLTVSGVGIGAFAYAGGSDQRAYVVPGPRIVAAVPTPPTNPGPQAMWPGYIDTTSCCISWWGPLSQTTWTTGAPDYYKVYANGALVCGGSINTSGLTNPGVTADGVPVQNSPAICNWYVGRGLTPGSTVNWQVTCVTGGQESLLSNSPVLSITLLAATSSQSPAAPTPSPDSWIAPPTVPTGGTLWTVTNNTAGGWNTAGSGAKGNVGCGFLYALTNCNHAGGDVIGVEPLVYPVPTGSAGFQMPVFTGTNGVTWIGSTEAPEYQAFIGGSAGTLPPYSYVTASMSYVITCTAAPALGATSATLSLNQAGLTDSSGNWLLKSGLYLVNFYEGTGTAMVNEERLVLFTQGSATIDWHLNNGNYPSPGLLAAASATMRMEYLNGVTPVDIPSMPTFRFGGAGAANQACFSWPAGCTNVRLVGINRTTVPGSSPSILTYDLFTNVTPANMGPSQPVPASQITFDRCIRGEDTGLATFVGCQHGLGSVNCNYLLTHQCFDWGIAEDFTVATGDTNHFLLGGGWHCFQNSYFQCGSESILYGGAFVSPPPNMPHDVTTRYCMSHKPLGWLGGAQTNILAWTGSAGGASSSLGATGATLSVPWQFASGTGTFRFSDGEVKTGAITNGNSSISWTGGLTGASVIMQIQVTGSVSPFGRFGAQVKNHFEKKACSRFEEYGNRMFNCWNGLIGGYHATPFSWGARDQPITGGAAPGYAETTPYCMVEDGNVHDNEAYNIGSPFFVFTGDHNAPCSTRRTRFSNNLAFMNQGLPLTERQQGLHIEGAIPDLMVQHNTLLVNPQAATTGVGAQFGVSWVQAGNGAIGGTYPNPPPYSPNAFSQYQDRMTVTDNLVDSGVGTGLAFNIGSGLPSALPNPFTTGAYPNIVMNKNATLSDTGTYAQGTIRISGYAAAGFVNVPSSGLTTIPLQASDCNLAPTSAYYASGTDGLPLGANFAQSLQFPLVGGVYIAGSVQTSFGTSAFQDAIANNNDVAVIGTYPGWTGGGFTMASAAAAIKAINPTIKLVPYTNIMELEAGVGSSGSAYSPIFNAATTMNWFLRTAWPSGSITDADGNAQDGLNQTTFTVAGTGSYAGYANYLAWRASWTAANEYPGSNWDGVYLDNVFSIPRVSADYNQSGSSQTASAAKTNWQNGYVVYAAPGGYLRTALPAGKLVFGNSADWANTSVTAYNGMLDGPVIEGVTTYQTTWATQIAAYKASMLNTRTPSFAIYCQDGVVTNYQFFRYGFTMCLLDNAYYYHSNNGSYDTVEVYDEYSFNLGAPIAGPNNASNGTLSNGGLTVWKSQGPSGVWRRDFVNGIAICNPAGNGSQSVVVDVSVNYWHLRGTQANPPNSATEVTAGSSVTLADGDGLILSRTAT